MIKLKIKALSLNHAYRGRRFKTKELDSFKKQVHYLSPKIDIPKGKLQAYYRFGVSSKNSDTDNLIKTFQDAISERFGFNDKLIYKIIVEKVDVKKTEEFIEFEITRLNNLLNEN